MSTRVRSRIPFTGGQMRFRLLALLMVTAVAAVGSNGRVEASTNLAAPVSGSFTAPGGSGPVGGVFNLEGFAKQDDALVAVGTVTYSLCFPGVDPKNCLATVTQAVALPVTSISGS